MAGLLDFTPLTIISELTSAPTPPVRNSGNGWGVVPRSWEHCGVEKLLVEAFCRSTNAVTVAKLVAGVPEPLAALADQTVTTGTSPSITATSHSYVTGDGPVYMTAGTTLPGGIISGKGYWINVVDSNTVKLCDSVQDAMNAGPFVSFSTDGTGTLKLIKNAAGQAATNRIQWLSAGFLGEAADGAMTLTSAMGFFTKALHHPRAVAYSIVATFGSANATTVILTPVFGNV